MASSSSSSSSSLWKFTVFLSFRGVDTRKTFVSFFYKELLKNGIETFKDDEELERGEYISPALLQGIEESKFAVVVMSENYASSGWCLEELAKIIECHKKGTLTAIPIFYEVEPSDVRRQTGKFAEHMKKHEGRENPEMVQRWRDALKTLASISGESSQDWKDDSKLVDKIVKHISDRLMSATPSDFSDLVGMDVRMRTMYELLGLESKNEVRVIGIWGMGGIGKTTLACYAYENIKRHFQAHCFLKNVKEIYGDHNPSRLQEELLSKFLGRALTVTSSNEGFNIIRARLGHQKILLVLDDVDTIAQLYAVAKKPIPFGPGSRVIVTTRDKRLLDIYGATHVYEIECFEKSEAFRLFCKHAFKQEHPFSGFEQLSDSAIYLAGGLPLAIKVFGSRLYGETKEDWEVVLNKLKRSPDKDVMEILKVSYDGLDEECKSIFLWVACLFNRQHIDHVTGLLDDNGGRDARYEIEVLVRRSLIAISSDGNITMHDLVQQMGRELVCQQSPREPGKRMLLWKPDEIRDVLTYNEGNKANIEGISLDIGALDELIISNGAFKNMPNLKYFKLTRYTSPGQKIKVSLPPTISFISRKLRYLEWHSYLSKTLQFHPKNLVELDLTGSKLEKLWEGSPYLRNLKKINLCMSIYLKEFPNLANAPNLEQIDASFCKSLTEIPSSVCGLSKLNVFTLHSCCQLERIPNNMDMESLQILVLHNCSNLKVFPQFSRGIRHVFLSRGRQRELPESIGYLSHLEKLYLDDFELLENLPDTIGNLTALRDLHLNNCQRLQRIPETVGDLISLQSLSLYKCPRIQKIPEAIRKLRYLIELNIEGQSITEFPNLPENIKRVFIAKAAIEEIPSWIGDLYYLEELCILENERLKCLPISIYDLKALQTLRLCGISNLESFPVWNFGTINCVGELSLEEISIRMPPLSNFANLKSLKISRGKKFDGVPFCCLPLSSFPSLEELNLTYLNMPEIPDDLGQLSHLHDLDLSGNDFEKIPASIRQLTKLVRLWVNSCEKLRSLPELPSSIIILSAQGCVALETTKNMLKHPLQSIRLTNCFKLKGDQGVTSGHWYREFACLPGGEVPISFNYRNTGHSLKISLPGEWKSSMLGFKACIVVKFEASACFEAFRTGWTCKFLQGNIEIFLDYEFEPWITVVDLPKDVAFQSDHLFFFKRDPHWKDDIGVVFDEVEFEFQFEICKEVADKDKEHYGLDFSPFKVKECGVSLYFKDDLKLDSEHSSPYYSSSSNPMDEQVEIKLNASEPTSRITRQLNNAISTSLSLTCGDSSDVPEEPVQEGNDINRKRSHGSIDTESIMDSQEEEEESSPRRSKFIRCF